MTSKTETVVLIYGTGDRDLDGISDMYDECPLAKETYNKFQDEDGCPILYLDFQH